MTAMKHAGFMRAGVVAALALAATQTPAQGQVAFEVQATPMVTGTVFLGDPPQRFAILRQQSAMPLIIDRGNYRDGIGYGANAGVRIAERFGLEGMFFWIPTRLQAEGGLEAYGGEVDVNSLMWGATALFYFPLLGEVEPFAGLGIGAETVSYDPQMAWKRHNDLMGNVVVGGSAPLTDRLALRLEARDCITRFDSHITGIEHSTENDLMLSAGLMFRSGRIW
jgi:hypothetical protein